MNVFSRDKPSANVWNVSSSESVSKTTSKNLNILSYELFEDLETLFNAVGNGRIYSGESSPLASEKNIAGSALKMTENNDSNSPIHADELSLEMLNTNGSSKDTFDNLNTLSKYANGSRAFTHQEENKLLKHFFERLLPLLDAHPASPWPDLALRYCDFNIARSCFISLASIHLYECGLGGKEYYDWGMSHINKTMDHLIQYIGSNENGILAVSNNRHELSSIDLEKKKMSAFVILVLVNVHILFAVLEKGKSACSRFFFQVFATICEDKFLHENLIENDKKASLVVVLSWYDTVSAIVSPDFRLPFCSPSWYGTSKDTISTSKMMGCPGEIFQLISKVCVLRHNLKKRKEIRIVDSTHIKEVNDIKQGLLCYRDYVNLEGNNYTLRLKGAQCWALATLATLCKVTKLGQWEIQNMKTVEEFIEVYGSMEPKSPVVTQMVWPVYAIGCECKTDSQKRSLSMFMETLYKTAKMGTLLSLKSLVEKVWESGLSQENVLNEWLDKGVDYLPL